MFNDGYLAKLAAGWCIFTKPVKTRLKTGNLFLLPDRWLPVNSPSWLVQNVHAVQKMTRCYARYA
jgi:hypothetical protein